MRALGLPNTKHFHEITKIEDAIARTFFFFSFDTPSFSLLFLSLARFADARAHTVAEKLKQEGRAELSHAETTEELEDEEGNVYNRKTYEDLKRQGLV